MRRARKRGTERKIKSLQDFARELACREVRTRRLVHCHGVFDLLHIGHIRHLQEARTLGDHLVVTLTPDRFVNKGPHRPAFSEAMRAEALAALECVDTVCINEWPTAVETIGLIRPAVFLKGVVRGTGPRDRDGAVDSEREAVQAVGGRLVLTDTELHSASALINRHTDVFSPAAKGFLEAMRQETSADTLVTQLRKFSSLRVGVVGSSAVADAIGGFCSEVAVCESTTIGDWDLTIVSEANARSLGPLERARLRERSRYLAVDLADGGAIEVDDWQDIGPDLLICNEPSASATHRCFPRTIAIQASGAVIVRDRALSARIEVPALPVNPVNEVDAEGTRDALVAIASAASARGLSPRTMGFLGSVASAAAATVKGAGSLDATSICRQIDSLLK